MALEARHLTKRFPSVVANDDVSIQLRARRDPRPAGRERRRQEHPGQDAVRALPPRRGRDPDQGRAGAPAQPAATPSRRGVGMVHQHFQLVPVFTVAENIMLGAETAQGAVPRRRRGRGAHPRARRPVRPRRRPDGPRRGPRRSARSSASRSSRRSTARPTSSSSTSRRPCSRPTETDELLEVMRDLAAARARRSSSSPTSCAR